MKPEYQVNLVTTNITSYQPPPSNIHQPRRLLGDAVFALGTWNFGLIVNVIACLALPRAMRATTRPRAPDRNSGQYWRRVSRKSTLVAAIDLDPFAAAFGANFASGFHAVAEPVRRSDDAEYRAADGNQSHSEHQKACRCSAHVVFSLNAAASDHSKLCIPAWLKIAASIYHWKDAACPVANAL